MLIETTPGQLQTTPNNVLQKNKKNKHQNNGVVIITSFGYILTAVTLDMKVVFQELNLPSVCSYIIFIIYPEVISIIYGFMISFL